MTDFLADITLRRFSVLAGTSLLMVASMQAQAACGEKQCACAPSEIQYAAPELQSGANGQFPIMLDAAEIEAEGEEVVTLRGDAVVAQGRQTIVADELKYYRQDERVVASGEVEMISENGDYIAGDSIDVHVPTQIGSVNNSEFKIARSMRREGDMDIVKIDSRGSADVINLEGEGLIRLEGTQYTNCKEGSNAVVIGAKELELDQISGVGKARHALVKFQGIPIFYAPYLSFPINDERKTGLLTPGFGNDEDSGFITEFPWYWNIAKNQDATITPRYFSDRGTQIGAEYRRKSSTSQTYIYGERMSSDDLYAEENVGEEGFEEARDMLTVQHYQQFTNNLSGSINYNDVSDVDYFDDFKHHVRYFSATYVPRDASLSYSGEYFSLGARANEYQIIDPIITESNKPYERLPSLSFSANLPEGPWGMKYGLSGSYTNFTHDTRLEGGRTAINSSVTLPFENIWGYAKPKIALRHRTYSLDNVSEGSESDPSFTVPTFSLDTGIYLEKNTRWFGEAALQTLEPRIFYVYAPEDEDQDQAPLFDTSSVSLNNFSGIFRDNRFYGEDRVGDTNQVTIGLTSRIIDNESGDQVLKASFGQLYRIDDLEQGLSANSSVQESGLGDFLAELQTVSGETWTTYSFIQYNHDDSDITTARFSVGYEPQDNHRKKISVGYYFAKGFSKNVEQLTLSAQWPISDRWQFFASDRYSFEDSENLSTSLGLEYNGCCWKLRLTGQERIANRNLDEKKTTVFLELELTSLGRLRAGVL